MGFPSKNTGMSSHSLLQGIFMIQGWNLHLLPWRQILLISEPPGKLSGDNTREFQRWRRTLFIHSSHKYILSSYCIPNTSRAGAFSTEQDRSNPFPHEVFSLLLIKFGLFFISFCMLFKISGSLDGFFFICYFFINNVVLNICSETTKAILTSVWLSRWH